MIASIVQAAAALPFLPRFLVDRGLSDGSLDISCRTMRSLCRHVRRPFGSSASAHRVALFTNFLQEHMRRTGLARDTESGR